MSWWRVYVFWIWRGTEFHKQGPRKENECWNSVNQWRGMLRLSQLRLIPSQALKETGHGLLLLFGCQHTCSRIDSTWSCFTTLLSEHCELQLWTVPLWVVLIIMDSDNIKLLLESQERSFHCALEIIINQYNSRIITLKGMISELKRSVEFPQAEVKDLKSLAYDSREGNNDKS